MAGGSRYYPVRKLNYANGAPPNYGQADAGGRSDLRLKNPCAFKRLGGYAGNFEGSGARITEHGLRICIARKARDYDDHDFPTPVYDPYGPGTSPDDIVTE
jgi:hypothetical protein